MKNNLLFILFACLSASVDAQKKPALPVMVGQDSHLIYTPDSLANRIPDFSYCGYMGGDKPIPDVPVRVRVPLVKGDATARIQAALDYVAGLPSRGAVLLDPGTYEVSGSLHINASGVVLRGNNTLLLATGTSRETLITIEGQDNRTFSPAIKIIDPYVPVNARKIRVATQMHTGDNIRITRPCTKGWIELLGTEHFGGGITSLGWKPGEREIHWDRKITAIAGDTITLDAPLTTALDTTYGGGYIQVYQWPGCISQSGVENLRCSSVFHTGNIKDEDHRWMAITIENTTDAWVRQVSFEHFAGSAVAVLETARRITVEDCISLAPISEIGGQRRNTFFTSGQQTLFQRNYAEYGYHDFATGFCVAGPNAFVQCESYLPFSYSGAIDSWASGLLMDIVQVDGQALGFPNRGQDGQGAGWSAANSMLWQCAAARIDCYRPPGANNWAFGSWAQFAGDGYWESSNEYVQPRSLYYAQLFDRTGDQTRAQLLPVTSEASSSPTVEQTAALIKQSEQPALTLHDWILQAGKRNPIPVDGTGAITIAYKEPAVNKQTNPLQISNGWLVRNGAVITGERRDVSWWRGSPKPYDLKGAGPHITRFVPGRTGTGLTDNLDTVTNQMVRKHIAAIEHNYGLWYDRRRDDHERVMRIDGDVWPPFYELPFARSGKGTAWDGLSKYDLTKYNRWYWDRLKAFATLADKKGLILIHQQYFQHNIIEAGAHYADFPWRPANNINATGFPEPPPYAGGKRIFMAEQFYDTTNAVRRNLHKAYIRQCLNNFDGTSSVIQLLGAEFTGPLHFVQFWTDEIAAWKRETGKPAIIGLSTTKDVQDAILEDKTRLSAIDLIDIRYWYYQQNGTAYAPQGGQNLAPRQHARLLKPKKTSAEQVYRAVREYRSKYPGKAVLYSADGYDAFGWAVFMAGGSLANIPVIQADGFLSAAASMQPADNTDGQLTLSNSNNEYIVYSTSAIHLDLKGSYKACWIDPKDGHVLKTEKNIKTLKSPVEDTVVLWLTRM
ncbi:hypothetical protein SAMN05428988_3301 [Chitinophaga sp. YR573]|uniref:DUF6298 domain-containing protein n=1 Tax=Chitinophaga sp. YR573 TaxID=1881040 RepID=UPI0008B534A2|nr:DUF6298 domain-containing protein [Chitinophaga sp. YR573]SEW22249.1 hypothetical protein SAMN05428988_3301 [Chitinophaga sp. YR573]